MSLVMRYSPSGWPSSSSSWNSKICVYVKLSRSLRNSSSCSVNFCMICCTGTGGGSLVTWAVVTCLGTFVFAGSAGALEGTTAPGGGGRGPCCCAAKGVASTAHAKIKSLLTATFNRWSPAMPKTSLLILAAPCADPSSPVLEDSMLGGEFSWLLPLNRGTCRKGMQTPESTSKEL